MAKAVSLGLVKLWEETLDRAVSGVMAKAKMIQARNKALARFQLENELGATELKQKLSEAKRVVESIEQALSDMGVLYDRYRHSEARGLFESAVEQRAREMNIPEVEDMIATVEQAREQVRLSVFPSEVQELLKSVREVVLNIGPALDNHMALLEKETKALELDDGGD